MWHVCRVLESEADFGDERKLSGGIAVWREDKGHGEGGWKGACENAERKKGLSVCQAQQVGLGVKYTLAFPFLSYASVARSPFRTPL